MLNFISVVLFLTVAVGGACIKRYTSGKLRDIDGFTPVQFDDGLNIAGRF